jgi:chromate reductase, NAD(P)H dehydrogenase (quinone)
VRRLVAPAWRSTTPTKALETNVEERSIRILGIAGSTRPGSLNRMALAAAAEQLPLGCTLDIFDLADVPLYLQQCEDPRPEPVSRLKAAIEASDAVLFATPEHNASIPAVLKGAIDWASRPMGCNSWAGKVGAVIGASPGVLGTIRAQAHLRQIMGVLDMTMLGQPDLPISQAHRKFDPHGVLMDEKANELLSLLMQRLVGMARALKRGDGQ